MDCTHTENQSQNLPADPRAWLDHFPAPRRGPVANWFHQAVRCGAASPFAVLSHVHQTLLRRLQWARDPEHLAHFHLVAEVLRTDHAGALAYAQTVLEYEALPLDARRRVKAERAFAYLKDAMKGKDVTPAQLAYLNALGYTGPQPDDRADASKLIDQLKRGEG